MEVEQVRTVATAAVRDASNGGELLADARALGLTVELLSGEQEATIAGLGVISAIFDRRTFAAAGALQLAAF